MVSQPLIKLSKVQNTGNASTVNLIVFLSQSKFNQIQSIQSYSVFKLDQHLYTHIMGHFILEVAIYRS